MVDPGDVGDPGGHPGGEHDVIEPAQRVDVGAGVQPHVDAVFVQHSRVVADRLGELFFAGNPFRQVELAADDVARLEQGDVVAALRGGHRRGQARRTRADHRHATAAPHGRDRQPGFAAGPRIQQT